MSEFNSRQQYNDINKNDKFNPETLSYEFLNEVISFEIFSTNKNGITTLSKITAPRAIKFIFDGYLFTSEEWLTKKIYHFDTENFIDPKDFLKYDDSKNPIETFITEFHFDKEILDARYSFSLALLQQIITKSFIIEDEKVLIRNPKMTAELIEGGSIQQYNFICNNKDVIKHLDSYSINALGYKYINIFHIISNENQMDFHSDPEYISSFVSEMLCLSEKYDNDSAIEILTTLETPPVESLSQGINDYCIEGSLVSHLLEGYFPIAGDSLINTPFYSLHKSLTNNLDNESYIPSVQENSFIKHASFAVQYLCRLISKSEGKELNVLDLFNSLDYINNLNLDFPDFQNALSLIPDDNKYYNLLPDEDKLKNWYNTPLAGWLILTKFSNFVYGMEVCRDTKDSYNNDFQTLFKLFDKKILDLKINFEEELLKNKLKPLSKAQTVRDLLKLCLELTK